MRFRLPVPRLDLLRRHGSFSLFFHKPKPVLALSLMAGLLPALFAPTAVAQSSTNAAIFQYAVFYEGVLEFTWTANMVVNGPVYANGQICVGTSASLNFLGPVTTTKTVGGPPRDGAAPSPWNQGTTFNGGYVTNVPAFVLPFGTNNPHTLIEIPPANEFPDSSLGQSRLYNRAQVILLVTNLPVSGRPPTPQVTFILQQSYLNALPADDPDKIYYTYIWTNYVYTNATAPYKYTNSIFTNLSLVAWTNEPHGIEKFLSVTNTFTDKREYQTNLFVTQIDVLGYTNWLATNGFKTTKFNSTPPTVLYVADRRNIGSNKLSVVRLVNGAALPPNYYGGVPLGWTVATPNPLYVKGNYNVTADGIHFSYTPNSTTNSGSWVPAALMCDAITILSSSFNDLTSSNTIGTASISNTVNAAIITGNVPSTGTSATNFSGGVQNLMRLLENWTSSIFVLNTSIVDLWASQTATNQFRNPTGFSPAPINPYYSPPTRQWAFDANFLNVAKLPPLTPLLNNAPVITTQPQSQAIPSGNTAIFTVTASGFGLLTYQWSFNGTNVLGATNSSLTLTNVQFSQAGNYAVLVTNLYGSVLSSNAVLTVTATPPTIQTQPTNQTVFVNGTATFRVMANGSFPLSCQWNFNGINIDGATNALLTLANVQTNQAGNYSVQVANAFGLTNSISATLTVIALPPTILTQPTNQTIFVYSNATFSVTASGSSPLSYQWSFNGTNIDGATNIMLTLTNVQPAQAGNYAVQVTNPFGSTNSANATLAVVAQPTILVQPVNQTLMAGNTAFFSVTAVGFSPLNYQWQFNGTNLVGNTNSLLTLAGVNTNNNGSYQVIVTNFYGSVTSSVATLTLTRSFVVVWGNQTNVPDGLANVTAIAAGSGHNMALEANGTVAAWGGDTFGETDVPADLTNVVAISAGVSDSLALQSNGKVIGWGFDSGGQINIPQNLTNVVAIAAGGFHSLALQADGTVAAWGEDYYGQTDVPSGLTNVVAIAAGGFHGLALQANGTVVAWGHYGYGIANVPAGLTNVVAIAGGHFHSLALRANGTVAAWGLDESGQTDVPLGLTNVVAITAGDYFSLALQANGTIVGWGYTVNGDTQAPTGLTNVIAIAAGNSHSMALENDGSPVVLRQPKSQTALTGTTITFTEAVVGRSQLSYQWQKNGTNLTDGGNVSGTTTATLTLASVQTNGAGIYALIVTNDFGSITSSNAVLTVLVPPSITTQPTSCTNVVGATASFSVVAGGTALLIYQWQSNGTNLVDATNAMLTLNDITLDQAGTYSVTVTNIAGSITSSNAVLSVYATAAATLGACSFSGDNGFQFQVAGVPGFNYSVQESTNLIDWVSLITNTSPFSFTDGNATNSPQQFYRAISVP